jgi:hypothetical protein
MPMADRIEGELDLAVPDAMSAARWRALVDAFLARESKIAEAHGLTLTATTRDTPEGLTTDVHVDGLIAFFRSWAAEHGRMLRPPSPTPVPETADAGAPAGIVASAL